jgi:hypothetical protein
MTSVEACWTVRFGDPHASDHELNGGILVLETGRIFGGDSGYAYLGTYEIGGATIEGKARIIQHDPDVQSMYGAFEQSFEASFQIVREGSDVMRGKFCRAGYPDAVLILRRLADLP